MKRGKLSDSRIIESYHEATLYARIRELVITARQTVVRGVDLVQVWTNYEIGRHIVEHEQQGSERAPYGQTVLKKLANELTSEFGRGFSKSNLAYMRRFFLLYQDRDQITQSDSGQSEPISVRAMQDRKIDIAQFRTGQFGDLSEKARPFRLGWTHYIFLMGIQNSGERSFYEIEAVEQDGI